MGDGKGMGWRGWGGAGDPHGVITLESGQLCRSLWALASK